MRKMSSPISEALAYHNLNFRCPYCNINIIIPKRVVVKKGEEVFTMRCPKCHEEIKAKWIVEEIQVEPKEWNPSRRYP